MINGDGTGGVTTMFMGEGLDTGDMLLKAETPVGAEETAGQLFDRLKDLGADLLLETLEKLEQGTLTPVPQNEEDATHAPHAFQGIVGDRLVQTGPRTPQFDPWPEPLAFCVFLFGR